MLFNPRLLVALLPLFPLPSHASPAAATSTPNDDNNNVQIVLAAARAASSSISEAQLSQRRRELRHLVGTVNSNIMQHHPADPLDVVFSYARATPQAGLLLVPVSMGDAAASEERQLGRTAYLTGLRQPGGETVALPKVHNLGDYDLPGLRAEGAVVFRDFFWHALENTAPAAAPDGQQAYVAEVLRLLRKTEGWIPM